jgi:hypothetical protein
VAILRIAPASANVSSGGRQQAIRAASWSDSVAWNWTSIFTEAYYSIGIFSSFRAMHIAGD